MPAVEQRGDFAEEEGVKVAHLGEAPPGQAVVSGAPSQDDDRIAELIPPPPLDVPLDAVPADHPMRKTFGAMPPTSEAALAAETPAWRRAEIGSANGYGNARSLVRPLSPISLGGTANGVRLLGPLKFSAMDVIAIDSSGPRINLAKAEDRAFWTRAIVEVLRHTGIRIEELLELTHLSLRPFRKPDGQIIPLLQIAPVRAIPNECFQSAPNLHTSSRGLCCAIQIPPKPYPMSLRRRQCRWFPAGMITARSARHSPTYPSVDSSSAGAA